MKNRLLRVNGHIPSGQFRGTDRGQWEYGKIEIDSLRRWDWEISIGLASRNGWKTLHVEGATEQHAGFLKALREIIKKYPEVADFVVRFDGPWMAVSDVVKLTRGLSFQSLTFYHGTSSVAAGTILKHGLSPRSSTGSGAAYGASLKPSAHPDAVYLTTQLDMAKFAARDAAMATKSEAVILKIDGFDGNPENWISDEDSGVEDPMQSVQRLGSVAYRGTIPARYLRVTMRLKPAQVGPEMWISEASRRYEKAETFNDLLARVVRGADPRVLVEKTRYAREKGKPFPGRKSLRSLSRYLGAFAHFSDREQIVGTVNPKFGFKNPTGRYAYLIDKDFLVMIRHAESEGFRSAGGAFDFGTDRKWIHIYKSGGGKVIHLDNGGGTEDYTQGHLHRDIKKMEKEVRAWIRIQDPPGLPALRSLSRLNAAGNRIRPSFSDLVDDVASILRVTYMPGDYVGADPRSPFSIIWLLTKELSGDNPSRWAKLLKSLGIGAVVDHGYGLIHPDEPEQALLLTAKSVDVIENPLVQRRRRSPEILKKLSRYFLRELKKMGGSFAVHVDPWIPEHIPGVREAQGIHTTIRWHMVNSGRHGNFRLRVGVAGGDVSISADSDREFAENCLKARIPEVSATYLRRTDLLPPQEALRIFDGWWKKARLFVEKYGSQCGSVSPPPYQEWG